MNEGHSALLGLELLDEQLGTTPDAPLQLTSHEVRAMTRVIVPGPGAAMTAREYYRHETVRARIRDYCGATDGQAPTCFDLVALTGDQPLPMWESAPAHLPEELDALLDNGADLARSLCDREHLPFYLDLDYLNANEPAEPFLHPADVFFRLEPVYRAAHDILHAFGLLPLEIITGRGYHFTGRIPWMHPAIDRLAALASEVPFWYATIASRHPTGSPPTLDERRARAAFGLGLLIEYAAHLILRRAAPEAPVPVVLNGTEVGAGLTGRACVSIDLSHAGDPLDVRHLRVAFGAYQLHRLRADIFGPNVAAQVPTMVAVPRREQSLYELLTASRYPAAAVRDAEHEDTHLPDVAAGVDRLLIDYGRSRLASFHRDYYAVTPHPPEAWPETYDRLDVASLPPCVAWPLMQPNDLLLQPARVQHLTRGLMAEGWPPRHIAGLVHSRYARDYGWGTRWSRLDARTRAEFDVRVFAGLVAAGLDEGIDFNCVSAQEKGLCPHDPNCHRDLRANRSRLLKQWHGGARATGPLGQTSGARPMPAMHDVSQQDVIDFLMSPSTHGGTPVERIDTHSAIVFLAGSRALKLKRAVTFDYVDFSTMALRKTACEAELRINRRAAPSIYRGVVAVTRQTDGSLALNGMGAPVDWLVDMTRFDQDLLFDRMAARSALDLALMGPLAGAIAEFHRTADRRHDHGGRVGMAWVIDGNAEGFAQQGAGMLDQMMCHALVEASRAELTRHGALLDARRAAGFVRQCHGDLHLRNLVLIDGRPTLFDAIEFNDEIACVDVLYDLAFLVMDLWHRHLPRHANAVLNAYLAETRDLEGLALLPLFLSCRAAVRAKTSATAARLQSDPARGPELETLARAYLAMAADLLKPPPARLIAIGGLSGSGKSTVAYGLAPTLGAVPGALVLRSDEIRKAVSGVPPLTRLGPGGYTPELSARVYGILQERAALALAAGHSVIADAVFARPADREAIEAVAAAAGVPFTGIWLEAPADILQTRTQQRTLDASDADASVVRQQLATSTGAIRWHGINADRTRPVVLSDVQAVVAAGTDSSGKPGQRGS